MNILKLLFAALVVVGLCTTTFAATPPSFVVAGSVLKNTLVVDSFGIRTTNGTFWFANKKLNFSTDTTWINKLLRADSISVISGTDTIRIRANGISFGTTTRKLYFSPDTLGVGSAAAPTAVLVFRDATDTAYVRQKYADSTLEISLDKGSTWWELFSYINIDTIGDGSGIQKVKGPVTFREGNNTALSVLPGNIVRVSSTGGGGDDVWADSLGSGLGLINVPSPVVIQVGSGISMSVIGDTIRIRSVLGPSVDSSEMAAGLAGLRNNSVNTDKIVDLTIVAADIANGTITGAKLASETITSSNILNGTIALADLSSNSIDSTKIIDNSVATADLHDTAVTTAKLKDLSVTSIKIANNAVGSGQLATGAVGSLQISDGSIGAADLAQSYLQDNKPDTISWNSQTQGGIFSLKVTDTVNRKTNTNIPADTGAKFQIVNLSTVDSTVTQIEMKFRQTGTSVLNIVGRNLGADENRLEIWTEHLGVRAGRLQMYGTGTSGDSSVLGSYGSTKLVFTGGSTREIIFKDTVTILGGCLRVIAAPGSGVLRTDTLRADSATITKYLELNGTRFDNLTGFGMARTGTTLRLDTATVKLLVDTGLANSYWSTTWPVKIKAGTNITLRRSGDSLVINSTGGGGGSGQWDIRNNNDTSVLKGISDTLLKVQKVRSKYVMLSSHNMDTLHIRANTLMIGDSGLTSLSAGLILGADTITDLTGFGLLQSTTFKTDVDTAALKPIFKPRYREVAAQRIHFRQGTPADSLYASLGVFPDSSTGIVWDVIDSSKTANKVDFIYFSVTFPDTMNADSVRFEYVTSGSDSSGAMIDSVRVYKEYSPTSGLIDSPMYNVGVKKTGNSRAIGSFGFTAKGVQPGERWSIRFRNKFTAANSCVKIAMPRGCGVPK